MIIEHKDLTGIDIHSPFKWAFADETERLAYTEIIATDIKKLAVQDDDDSIQILVSDSPIIWQAI